MANQLLLLLWKSWKTFIRSRGWLIAQGIITAILWLICIATLYSTAKMMEKERPDFEQNPNYFGLAFKCFEGGNISYTGCSSDVTATMAAICTKHSMRLEQKIPGWCQRGPPPRLDLPFGMDPELVFPPPQPHDEYVIRELTESSVVIDHIASFEPVLSGPRMHASRQFSKSPIDSVVPLYNREVYPTFTMLAEHFGKMKRLGVNYLDVTFSRSAFDNDNIGTWMILFTFVITMFIFSLQAAVEVTQEASNLIKDYLLSMGMSRTLYFLHHFIFHFIKSWTTLVVFCVIMGVMMKSISFCFFMLLLFTLAFAAWTAMSLTIGACFKKTGHTVVVTLMVWITQIIVSAFVTTVRRTQFASIVCSICPLYAAYLAIDAKKEADLRGTSLWFSEVKYAIPQGYYMLVLVFDIFFYFFLAVFIDWVRNSCENPLAMLRKGSKMNQAAEEENQKLLENQEKSDAQSSADLIVEGLHKVYSTGEHAVKGVDMRMHRGQVTALLGHNGAGKSTIFSMIAGMAVPTKGRIEILGSESMADRQKQIGYCPQYNPIFPKLTVNEHLSFFARLKDCPNGDATGQKVLSLLGMAESGTVWASKLSGGMKRKLCMAISMAANSPIVLLDEPTAGLDPGARRDFEKLLLEWKKEHTILLTTHYTDEAELLADRIFIVAKGRVFCSGSAQFLRKKFDSGYVLSFAIEKESEVERATIEMINIVKEFVPNTSLYKTRGKQFELKLITDDTKRFVEMFRKIEEAGPSIGMHSYGLSMNKLEQVFLKVGEMTGTVDRTTEVQTALKELIQENENRAQGFAKASKQMAYTMLKRLYYDLAHIPSLIVIVALVFGMTFGMRTSPGGSSNSEEDNILSISERYRIGVNAHASEFEKVAKRFGDYLEIIDVPSTELPEWYQKNALTRPPLLGAIMEDAAGEWTIHMHKKDLRFLPTMEVIAAMVNNPALDKVKFGAKRISHHDIPTTEDFLTRESGIDFTLKGILMSISSLIVCRPLAFHIIERISNYRHQQRLTGFSRILFVFTTFSYDFALFLLHFLAYFIGCFAGNATATKKYISPVIYLPLLHFLSAELMILAFHRVFATRAKGEVLFHLAIIFVGVGAMMTKFQPQDDDASVGLLVAGHFTLNFTPLWAVIWMKDEWKNEIANAKIYGFLFISIHFFLLIASLVLLEFGVRRLRSLCKKQEPVNVNTEQGGGDLVLRVNNLHKRYGRGKKMKVAVKGISFGVRAHECFGVLGINGAGKTSTFEVLTGNAMPDGGSATVGGVDCSTPATIGYCPQFDALVDDLTGRQSLVILAALHGYENPRKVADIVITCVGMQSHADKKTKRYSGGQRRKISVAASLLAQNSLIILDEPTAGIDPIARRDIWSVICALRESTNTAIVLTSHSMDEVEALVSNLIIMRAGSIVVEGSPQMIKNSFGDHYSFNLMIDNVTDVAQITSQVLSVFPTASLYDSASLRNIKYRIPRSSSDVFSSIFEKAAGIADQLKAADFCFTQATLEDAFILASTAPTLPVPMGTILGTMPVPVGPGPVPVGTAPNPDGTASARPNEPEPVLATTMDPTAVSGTQTGTQTGTKSVTKSEPMSDPKTK